MAGESLRAFARRAARREMAHVLEEELLGRTPMGLAVAVVALLAALLATEDDAARIAALAVAAASILAALAVAIERTWLGRPTHLGSLLRVDPSGELAAAFDLLGSESPFALLAVRAAEEKVLNTSPLPTSPRFARGGATVAVLALSAAALAFSLVERASPPLALDLGPGAREPIHREAETRAVHEAAKLLALRARELAQTPDGHDVALELARAARELDGGATPRAAMGRLAHSRGELEATRSAGLGEALDRAAASLAQSPALRDLAKALDGQSPPLVAEKGQELAKKLGEGKLDDAARSEARNAAARAAQALSATSGAEAARKGLEGLSKELDQGSKESQKQAAEKASSSLAQAAAQARKDAAREQASRALDEARSTLAGEKSPPRPGGGDARSGEKRATPNKEAGGDGPHIAGKGGTKDEREPPTSLPEGPEPGSRTASLRGLVGERGASAILAAEGFAKGERSAPARAVVKDYQRVEEAALDREPLPLDRKNLVKRYFEALEERR